MASADDKKELLSVPSFCVYKLSGTEFRHRNLQEFRPEGQMASANRCSKYVCLFVLMCNCSFENLIEHTIYQTFNLFSSDQKSWCVSMSNLKVRISSNFTFLVFQNGDGPLHIAVALGRKRMAKKLIRLGAAGHIRTKVENWNGVFSLFLMWPATPRRISWSG